MESSPVYHIKGWGKFKRYFRDFCTRADIGTPEGGRDPVPGLWEDPAARLALHGEPDQTGKDRRDSRG